MQAIATKRDAVEALINYIFKLEDVLENLAAAAKHSAVYYDEHDPDRIAAEAALEFLGG